MNGWMLALCLVASAATGGDPVSREDPKLPSLELFAREAWYRNAPRAEEVIEGTLELNPGTGRIGPPTRFNSYRLAWKDEGGKPQVRELHTPVKSSLLAAYLGHRVRLTGKTMERRAEDTVVLEIWPARLEPVGAGPASLASVNGIHARCGWQPPAAQVLNARTSSWVIRNASDLARLMKVAGPAADRAASEQMARLLQIGAIDWDRHLLLCVAAGLQPDVEQVEVTRAVVTDRILTLHYRLPRTREKQTNLSFPAATVLVDRWDGEVRFVLEKPMP